MKSKVGQRVLERFANESSERRPVIIRAKLEVCRQRRQFEIRFRLQYAKLTANRAESVVEIMLEMKPKTTSIKYEKYLHCC